MTNFKVIRLDKTISTGTVLKVFLPTEEGEIEHSYQIIVDGGINLHQHTEKFEISEGYREIDPTTGLPISDWAVVGAGFPTKTHSVQRQAGLRIIESSKRGPGRECWPELKK